MSTLGMCAYLSSLLSILEVVASVLETNIS